MSQSDPLKALIDSIPGRTVAASLRRIMPEIDRRVRDGVRHEDIVAALNANGFALNLNTFRSNLYRYRKQHRTQTGQPASEPAPKATPDSVQASADADTPGTGTHWNARPALEAVLDARKRGETGDAYLGRSRPLFRKDRSSGA